MKEAPTCPNPTYLASCNPAVLPAIPLSPCESVTPASLDLDRVVRLDGTNPNPQHLAPRLCSPASLGEAHALPTVC
ncbi:hypothetical protein P167DRAFT_537723, partial [Morchella conica CCBAS932]